MTHRQTWETLKVPKLFPKIFHPPRQRRRKLLGTLFFAARFSLRLLTAGSAALIHALIPAWFETTASRQVSLIH